ncbi:hypothetical protein [Roseovarius sp. 2305UL8-3]|uniref:hypothetical protein n=1 Tax=Roseovarius conchicola TaxID=3121636 RepID=UPI003526D134
MRLKYRMRWSFVVSLLPLLALSGLASWQLSWLEPRQTLPGRLSTYHKVYGFWDVACDTAMDGTDHRCYIQYVDVYRPRPDFAAAMVEVVMHEGVDGQADPHIRFDVEPGFTFRDTSIAVITPSGPWPVDIAHCAGSTCRISGDPARALLDSWAKGKVINLEIEEGRAQPAKLSWPLDDITTMLDDFATQRAARNLP